jgi:Tfp pilus assembly protein PilV
MTGLGQQRKLRMHDDRGVTIVLVAVLAVVLLLVAALAIDGGLAYANRRQMQNAADASAMAGTRMVDEIRFPDPSAPTPAPTPDEIWTAIDESRKDNAADSMVCYLIDAYEQRLASGQDACASPSAMVDAWNNAGGVVAGVEVEQTGVKSTFFARIRGADEVSATARAAATIQPYVGGAAAPFIICGYLPRDSSAYDMLDEDGNFKPEAFVRYGPGGTDAPFDLQGGGQEQNEGIPGCGLGPSFNGKLDEDVTNVVVGTPAKAQQGNGFNEEIRNAVVDSQLSPCPDEGPFDGCGMLLPIANDSNDEDGNDMYITPANWGVFKVYGNGKGNAKYTAELLAEGSVVDGGIGGAGDVGQGQARVIKLVK